MHELVQVDFFPPIFYHYSIINDIAAVHRCMTRLLCAAADKLSPPLKSADSSGGRYKNSSIFHRYPGARCCVFSAVNLLTCLSKGGQVKPAEGGDGALDRRPTLNLLILLNKYGNRFNFKDR